MSDKLFSEEAEECKECLAEEWTIKDGVIQNPGRFEGETLVAYHAYHVMLDGGADDDDGPAWRIGNVICEESEQGFVYCSIFDSDQEAVDHWEKSASENES